MIGRHLFLGLWLCGVPSLSVAGAGDLVRYHAFQDSSCGAWIKSENNIGGRAQYLYWVRGFVSGVNWDSATMEVTLDRMPNFETLSLYIDKFCREHPLQPFINAAPALVKELATKR